MYNVYYGIYSQRTECSQPHDNATAVLASRDRAVLVPTSRQTTNLLCMSKATSSHYRSDQLHQTRWSDREPVWQLVGVVGIDRASYVISARSTRPLPDQYLIVTRSYTSGHGRSDNKRVKLDRSSFVELGRGIPNLVDRDGRVDLIGSGNVAVHTPAVP